MGLDVGAQPHTWRSLNTIDNVNRYLNEPATDLIAVGPFTLLVAGSFGTRSSYNPTAGAPLATAFVLYHADADEIEVVSSRVFPYSSRNNVYFPRLAVLSDTLVAVAGVSGARSSTCV